MFYIFILNFLNPVCVLYFEYISVRTSHSFSATHMCLVTNICNSTGHMYDHRGGYCGRLVGDTVAEKEVKS